jgi:cell pole-organizing protein PopZ
MAMTKVQKKQCSEARKAFRKRGSDPTISLEDFRALVDAMTLACGTPEDYAAKHSQTDTKAADQPTQSSPAPDSQPQSEPEQAAQSIPDLVAQSRTALNREIAIGNRLVANFKQAQTWEQVDADHPDAVALRDKIANEEKEIRDAVTADSELMEKIDVHRAAKECAKEDFERWSGLITEAVNVLKDVKDQQDRYHALGY